MIRPHPPGISYLHSLCQHVVSAWLLAALLVETGTRRRCSVVRWRSLNGVASLLRTSKVQCSRAFASHLFRLAPHHADTYTSLLKRRIYLCRTLCALTTMQVRSLRDGAVSLCPGLLRRFHCETSVRYKCISSKTNVSIPGATMSGGPLTLLHQFHFLAAVAAISTA